MGGLRNCMAGRILQAHGCGKLKVAQGFGQVFARPERRERRDRVVVGGTVRAEAGARGRARGDGPAALLLSWCAASWWLSPPPASWCRSACCC